MEKLVIGCGYLGLRVAAGWLEAGDAVYAVTRSPQRAKELQKLGLRPMVADVTEPSSLAELPPAATVLYAVGYDRESEKSIAHVYVRGLHNVLETLPEPGRIVYISSTGVYGQTEGEWVDEESACNPAREGGRACLEAERLLQNHSLGSRAIILRMGGIYGPGRIPRRRDLEEGRPIPAAEQGYLNLIHIEDAVEAVLAAERRASPPALYAVTDGNPALRGDYFRELARLMGAPPPNFAPPDPSSPRAARAASDKRISNRKMLDELQIELRRPSYREGLAAILAEE